MEATRASSGLGSASSCWIEVRTGDGPKTKGTAYVVFEEIGDAKKALDHLNGFHLQERYIVGEFCEHTCGWMVGGGGKR